MTTSPKKRPVSPRQVLLPVLGILTLVVAGLFLLKYQMKSEPTSFQASGGASGLRENDIVPADFEFVRFSGEKVQASKLVGKLFLINFWATWCTACLEEMPAIVELREKFKNREFEVLGINLDENPEAVVPRATKRFKMEFPIFKDPDGKTADLFDIHAIPVTVIMNHERRILLRRDGGEDWSNPKFHSLIEQWLSQ